MTTEPRKCPNCFTQDKLLLYHTVVERNCSENGIGIIRCLFCGVSTYYHQPTRVIERWNSQFAPCKEMRKPVWLAMVGDE